MTTEKNQRAAHTALGIWCTRCSELADVVAIYQHGRSTGHPLGREDKTPLCARCGTRALERDNPRPRLIEHEAALARHAKAERARRRGGQPPKLKLKAASGTGSDRHG